MKFITCLLLANFCTFYISGLPADIGATRSDIPDERYLALAREPQFNCTGLILKNGKPNASAVLIAPGWIITAGHEVYGLKPEDVRFYDSEKEHIVTEIVMYSGYQAKGVLGHNGDLALLRLAKPITHIKPALLYTEFEELGKVGTTVGFGRSGSGASIITNPTPVGTKRAGQNMIDSIGGEIDGRLLPDHLLVSDFDHPIETGLNRIGKALPLELEYCPVGGDSGGGLFITVDNRWYLAGLVTAFSPKINDDMDLGLHGSLSYWTRLSVYSNWISDVIAGE